MAIDGHRCSLKLVEQVRRFGSSLPVEAGNGIVGIKLCGKAEGIELDYG